MTDADRSIPTLLGWWWSISTLVLFGATWPVWRPDAPSQLPRIPLFGWGLSIPIWAEWLALVVILAAVSFVALMPGRRRMVPAAVTVWIVASSLLIVADQLRYQPWWIHLAVSGVVLASASPRRIPLLWMLFLAGMYGWSAWSKWDYSFFVTHGRELVAAVLKSVSLPVRLSPEALSSGALLLPLGETLVAGLLLFSRTRRLALWAAMALHALLGLALGPTGLDHSRGVLAWNIVCIAQLAWLLTLKRIPEPICTASTVGRGDRFAAVVLALVMSWPLLAPWGLCDPWPAWELYAARPARVELYVAAAQRSQLPPAVRHFVDPQVPGRDWCSVRLDRWALEELAVPIAPGRRVKLALSAALCRRENWPAECRVENAGPANRWTGERTTRLLRGIGDIRRSLDEFWLNVRPRPRAGE